MKCLVVILLVAALIAEYEMIPKIKIRCRKGYCRVKIKYRSLPDPGLDSSDELKTAHPTGRDVDEINEGDLDSKLTALLDTGLQQLLQKVLNKREEAEDGTDDI